MGKNNMNGIVWYIGIKQNKTTFYVADYDGDDFTVLWSKRKENCISFKTERAAHRVIHKHFNNRTDIFLVQSAAPT